MKYANHSLPRLIISTGLLMASVFPTAITSPPYVIATQGVYCLTGNLSTSITTGSAIEIQANNVTLDLNGFKLGELVAGATNYTNP